MTKLRASMVLGAALLAGSVAIASAADLPQGSMKDGYYPAPVASSPASWYVRLDTGHARYDDPTIIEIGRFEHTNPSIDSTWSIGGGIGYYFSKSVRGDLTWDHRFETDVHGAVPFGQGPGPLVSFPGQRVFGLKSDVFLANLYYDIDTRSRFTPYFGVGLGFAHNKTTNGTVIDTGNIGFTNAVIAGDSKWATAGALMGGFSFAMRDRLHLDAGYRYLYVGDARTGLITGTVAPLQNPGNDGDPVVKDIWSHEFRIGLRYDIR